MRAGRQSGTRLVCCVIGFLAALAGMQPLSAADAEEGLVAHYTFDEGPGGMVKDHSGNGNDGTIIDDVTYVSREGENGYVLRFNSGKAYVDCGNEPSLDLTEAVTLELWFYPETLTQQGLAGVVGKILGSYCLNYGQGAYGFHAPGGSNHTRTKAVGNSWHHVVATFDGTHIKVYVNGELHGVKESEARQLPHGDNFYLRYPAIWLTVEPDFKCMMDDVRVYNRALSEKEIVRHYRKEAKATGRHDTTWFDKVNLTLHRFPQSATVVVEADVTQMDVASPGYTLQLELRDTASGKVLAQQETPLDASLDDAADEGAARLEFSDYENPGVSYWTVNVEALPPGDYDVRAVVRTNDNEQTGVPSAAGLTLPLARLAWNEAYKDATVSNNLVAGLLQIQYPQHQAQHEYTFLNPRNGWVFISSTAETRGAGRTLVSVDASAADSAAIVHSEETADTLEAMRYLPQGSHKLYVHCEGAARLSHLIVRAIPEMMVAGLGYTAGGGWPLVAGQHVPILPCFGHYNMAYLERIGLLDSINVLVERNPVSENVAGVRKWRDQGKKLIVRYPMYTIPADVEGNFRAWTDQRTAGRGLAGEDYDGIIVDELSGSGHSGGLGRYPQYGEAARRIAQDPRFKGKVFYPYCMPMYSSEIAMEFLRTVTSVGYKWAEEKYLTEQPTEKAAQYYMDLRLRQNLLRYHKSVPDCAREMIYTLGFMSAPPLTLNAEPGVDYKVYMDMQMHLLANDPVFFGLYGIQWYHNGYVDEEYLRWSAKLFRHYGIEGRKERLTEDPYILPHIKNADFDEGTSGWTLQPAEDGGISIEHAAGYGTLQTRAQGGDKKAGDNVLVTRRSARAPNRISQQVRQLTPGRTYSVKMFTADYGDLEKGESKNETHHINIRIDGVEMIPEKEFHQLFPSGMGGGVYGSFNAKNSLYLTYHRVVFRARSTTAMLTISDWDSDTDPGGPVGQQLMHNFVEVQPYLEE